MHDVWTDFLRWLLLFWGFVYLVTQSAILRRMRMFFLQYITGFGLFLYCPSCTGFWVGGLLLGGVWPWGGQGLCWPWDVLNGELLFPAAQSAIAGLACGRLWGVFAGEPVLQNEILLVRARIEAKGS